MNLIEAVKELQTNPLARYIGFPTNNGERLIELEVKHYCGERVHRLVFPETSTKRRQQVVAGCTEFLLRDDFYIVYKSAKSRPKLLTTTEIKQKVQELLSELERRASK